MSVIAKILPNMFTKFVGINKLFFPTSKFHTLTNEVLQTVPGGLYQVTTRTKTRCHFPRPSEVKRIKKHGWETRMSTKDGRRIIMNRILKGRWVYTH